MNKWLSKNKVPIIITLGIILYGLFALYCKSFGWDFSKSGASFVLDEMKTYFMGIGATWVAFFISSAQAKKEIEKEYKDNFDAKIKKVTKILIKDSLYFISSTLWKTMKPDYKIKKMPKIIKEDAIIDKNKFVNKYYCDIGKLDKLITDYEEKMNKTKDDALK